MFEEVMGERLRTSFADAPLVSIEGHEGITECVLRFDSSPLDGDGMNWVTILRFPHVLDLRFSDFELGLELSNRQDFAYALIRLVDSEILGHFADSKALTRTAMPVLGDSDLYHYRIAFDDHGTYDIVCTGIEISYERVAT
jgi:hypothetical protein